MEPPRQLCPRCGCLEFEWVDASHTRCVDCGLGATVSVITFAGSDGSTTPNPEAERVLAEHRAGSRRAVADRGFELYGLDDRWMGPRLLGGHGRSGDTLTAVTLVHGHPAAETGPLIRVETQRATRFPVEVARVLHAPSLVHRLVHQTGELRDDVRRAAFPGADRTGDPTEPWDAVTLPVDDASVPFRVLASAGCWVGLATVDDRVVSIESRSWPLELTGLETVADLAAYR